MGRIAREVLLYNGCYAHVFTRAIEKRKIFENEEDFKFFKKKMVEVKKAYDFKIFHYCLMQTHVHMVVAIIDVSRFAEGMKVLKKAYTHKYNTIHRRFGALWRDRYGVKLIENEPYLMSCGKYVENNPVDVGMVERATDWKHSSSRYYEFGDEDPVLDGYDLSGIRISGVLDKNTFEKSRVIGSDWFQYKVWKKLKG